VTYTKAQLVRVIVYLADKLEARRPLVVTPLSEDVQDCIEWARGSQEDLRKP
jgi:hypothetical protein